jgi:type I restriction enzyme, S subunit
MNQLWEDVTLEQVATEITVGHVGPMADEYVETGIPFLRSLNVEPFTINTNDLKKISREFHLRLKKSALKPGDIVIVRTGKPGSCAVIPDWLPEANCSDVVVVRASPRVRPYFISFVVNSSAAHHIDAYTVGAVQQHFNVGSARQIRFRLPPIAEQDRILGILGAMNDKIDMNRRMNFTLEATAWAIFKDWFVNFGPTRAKMDGRPPYLAPDIWSNFPVRLNPAIGLPEGWEEKPLTHFIEIIGGGTPKTSEGAYWGGNIPWFSVTDTPSGSDTFVFDTQKKITQLGLENSSATLIEPGETIISARGTVGNLARAGQPMTFNQSCYGLRGSNGYGASFVFLAAKNMVSKLQSMAHGSVFSTITRQTFEAISLPNPGSELAAHFERTSLSLFDRIKSNVAETLALAETRDVLLPKLMSGEIRVKDAEKIAGEAT